MQGTQGVALHSQVESILPELKDEYVKEQLKDENRSMGTPHKQLRSAKGWRLSVGAFCVHPGVRDVPVMALSFGLRS